MSNHSFPNVIQPNLGDEWSKRAGGLTSFFQDIGLPPGQHSQALYILPVRPRDADSYVDALRIKTANEGKWVFLTGTAGTPKPL